MAMPPHVERLREVAQLRTGGAPSNPRRRAVSAEPSPKARSAQEENQELDGEDMESEEEQRFGEELEEEQENGREPERQAEQAPARPQPPLQPAARAALPRTGPPVPLLAALGLACLASGLALRLGVARMDGARRPARARSAAS